MWAVRVGLWCFTRFYHKIGARSKHGAALILAQRYSKFYKLSNKSSCKSIGGHLACQPAHFPAAIQTVFLWPGLPGFVWLSFVFILGHNSRLLAFLDSLWSGVWRSSRQLNQTLKRRQPKVSNPSAIRLQLNRQYLLSSAVSQPAGEEFWMTKSLVIN